MVRIRLVGLRQNGLGSSSHIGHSVSAVDLHGPAELFRNLAGNVNTIILPAHRCIEIPAHALSGIALAADHPDLKKPPAF